MTPAVVMDAQSTTTDRVGTIPSLGEQLGLGPGHRFPLVRADPRWLEVHLVDSVDHDATDEGPQCVLVVGRHHIPRRPGGRRGGEGLLVRSPVLVPVLALGQIPGRELPILCGVSQSIEEAPLLLVTGDVQEDLDDPGPVSVEVALEAVDVLVAVPPDPSRWHADRGWLASRRGAVCPWSG